MKYMIARLAAARVMATRRDEDVAEFYAALRSRMPHAMVAPAIALISLLVGLGLLFGSAPMAASDTLISWGASIGTRTTNGEWWRLITSLFVNAGLFQLLVNVLVLLHVGVLLERLVGRLVPAAVYVSAGVITGLADLSARPIEVNVSTTGAAAGFYGLLAAVVITQQVSALFHTRKPPTTDDSVTDGEMPPEELPDVPIPQAALKKFGIGAGLFMLYMLLVASAGLYGFVVGLAYGGMLTPLRIDRRPTPRRVGIAAAVAAVVAAAIAFPMRSIADVKPEIARVIAAEAHTTKTYQAALEAFTKGRSTAEALARVADGANIAELQSIDARLAALRHVPAEHQPLVSDARDYLRLRCEAWRLRADAVRKANAVPRKGSVEHASGGQGRLQAEARFRANNSAMARAETAERASHTVFERLRTSATPQPQ
ncbi:MAG TPA: rhomboid family intramembrane serine protease [Vicinamibacterales bacterium]|nr:rhomboid family intramembrane serine protease [Vicinamibacterales bacterium]